MHRDMLLQLLENYFPDNDQESHFKKSMTKFVKQYPDCFERSLSIGHITASSLLVNNEESHALLMHHAKLGQWFQLGGHCDGIDDVRAVAIKEAQEESGINDIEPISSNIFDIDIHLIPATNKEPAHYHYDVRFLLKVTSNAQTIQNNESNELRWVGKDINALPTTNVSIVRMFNKWIQF